MTGRWYDPQVGRFVQEDPIHSGANDYTFAGNDPVNGGDPTGKLPEEQCEFRYYPPASTCDGPGVCTQSPGYEDLACTPTGGINRMPDFPEDGGGGGGGSTQPASAPTQPTPINCNTVLPNGQTVGSYVQAGRAALAGSIMTGSAVDLGLAAGGFSSSFGGGLRGAQRNCVHRTGRRSNRLQDNVCRPSKP